MNIEIRKTTKNEFDEVIKLTWETFLEFEAPDYDKIGINQFKKDIIENATFKDACISGKNKTFGAFDSNKLVGIIVIRDENHITLFFVKKEYQRKGIATQLFHEFVEEMKKIDKKENYITVNSSPYGIPFYHKIGFIDTNTEQIINGIKFTPMEYQLIYEGAK